MRRHSDSSSTVPGEMCARVCPDVSNVAASRRAMDGWDRSTHSAPSRAVQSAIAWLNSFRLEEMWLDIDPTSYSKWQGVKTVESFPVIDSDLRHFTSDARSGTRSE